MGIVEVEGDRILPGDDDNAGGEVAFAVDLLSE